VLRDARRAARSLRVSNVKGRSRCAEARQTIYLVPDLTLRKVTQWRNGERVVHDETRLRKLPTTTQTLLLKTRDTLVITRSKEIGRPAIYSVSLPEALEQRSRLNRSGLIMEKSAASTGQPARIQLRLQITQARPEGEKLGAEGHQSSRDAD
jgi:hypothetical protein